MNWLERAVERGATIVARVLTEQYLEAMKQMGFETVDLFSHLDKSPGCSNWKVYCHGERCIVDSNEKGCYMVHSPECRLYEFGPSDERGVICKKHNAPFQECRGNN